MSLTLWFDLTSNINILYRNRSINPYFFPNDHKCKKDAIFPLFSLVHFYHTPFIFTKQVSGLSFIKFPLQCIWSQISNLVISSVISGNNSISGRIYLTPDSMRMTGFSSSGSIWPAKAARLLAGPANSLRHSPCIQIDRSDRGRQRHTERYNSSDFSKYIFGRFEPAPPA